MDRRRFVGGLLAVPAAGLALRPGASRADGPAKLLTAGKRQLEINGRAASVYGLTDTHGRPGLTFEPGDRFSVHFENRLDTPTLIHWHGLTPPWQQDGVPGLTGPEVAPGAAKDYDFSLPLPGTNWMHAHTLQEQRLLAAPLVIRDPADRDRDEQEVTILLHDFSFTPAEELLARLKKSNGSASSMSGMSMDHGSIHHGAMGHGMNGMAGMAMDHDMGANAGMTMDLNDIEYDAYLANDRTLDDPEVVRVEDGGRVRLRIINGAAATVFTIDLGELEGELIAVDGMAVAPIRGRRLPLAMGQRADIRLVLPRGVRAYPILALREGARERTGIVLASPGAGIGKISPLGAAKGPVMDLALEARLRAAGPLPARTASARHTVVLTGSMERYSWRMEGVPDPLPLKEGDRVEIVLDNRSMMAHPMHLHGHHFQVVALGGKRMAGAVRDTVQVPPMAQVTIAFDAANPGKWAFHCHHLYHMVAGMMIEAVYEGVG